MNRIFTILTLTLLFSCIKLTAQNDLAKLFELADETKDAFEGFKKNLGGNEFSYHSFRNDITNALITRASNGKMSIEWQTAPVPDNWQKSEARFVWIAAVDINREPIGFDFFFNGQKRFGITSSLKKNWKLETGDGGILSFLTIETDQHGDAHGYMQLVAPASWIKKGEGQTITITGRAAGSNTWMIVYRADDALSYLQNSIEKDIWMELVFEKTPESLKGKLATLKHLEGKELTCTTENSAIKIKLKKDIDKAIGEFTLPVSAMNKSFTLNDAKGEVFLVKSLGQPFQITRLAGQSILYNECISDDSGFRLLATRNYKPNTVTSMKELSGSPLGKGEIFLMNSSHQDIA